jgi:4-amino-4-deoxy-L-arabinose transferase-like glycosyltransferase
VNRSPLFAGIWQDALASRWGDVMIILGLVLFASFSFYTTPEFAANLPEDGSDSAIPAVNLLERGKLVLTAYGHDYPPAHPFGLALLLLPAYAVAGHFLGNGIYAILFCALGSIAITYFLGVKLGGRWCGSFAALFLITHYGFWQYSQKIMSEVPSVFLLGGVLALMLSVPQEHPTGFRYVVAGAILGFAVTVRYDIVLWSAPAAALLLLGAVSWPERRRRVGLCLAGLAPWLLLLAVYHQVTFGSPWRTGYSYWGNAGDSTQPQFSTKYITTSSFLRMKRIDAQFAGLVEGNGPFYTKSLLAEADTTRIFGNPLYWPLPGRRIYQLLVGLRTALGAAGIVACLAAWRTNPLRQQFILWLILSALISIGLYMLFFYQEGRYLMRLVPLFCLANAMGLTALLAMWPAKPFRAVVTVLVSLLIAAFAFFNWQMGFPSGNDLHLLEVFTYVTRQMEPNAVVVTNFDPFRVDAYLIHGTKRLAVPLVRERGGASVFVKGSSTRTSFEPFDAVEDPESLRELLHSGRPVYWLIDNPWSGRPSVELDALQRSFRLQVLATASPNGSDEQPYFGRVHGLPQGR